MNILDGYRVLDLAEEKGTLASKLLLDMGAEVIRIEKPGKEVQPGYANSGKHCISLDIATQKGQGIFEKLAKVADVVIESFAPGYLSQLGLGYSQLCQINSRLIMATITDFGMSGPYCDKKSSDLVSSALGGPMSVCGEPEKPPLKPYGHQAYFTASLFAANGILLALWKRHSTQTGQHIDISIHECLAATLDHVLVRYFYEGDVAERQGSLYWNKAFRIFPCQDGYILLSLMQHWETLIELLDSEGLAGDLKDSRWQDEAERRNHISHIIEVFAEWTRRHSVSDLVELGQLMHFPWANVAALSEVVDNPQLNAREFFIDVIDPESGSAYKFPGSPVKMSRSHWQVDDKIPRTGEYNHEVFSRRLGLSEREMARLAQERVI
jgi:crotonobetainyl-CoA:carnitine CoA-transferase CaiB-like acyl-CoA transferase